MQSASKVSALRRELNSHDAAEPRSLVLRKQGGRARSGTKSSEASERELRRQSELGVQRLKNWSPCADSRPCTPWEAGQFHQPCRGVVSNPRPGAVLHWWLEHVVRIQQQRDAGGALFILKPVRGLVYASAERVGRGALPNPSFKRTANGASPWPRGRVVYHRPRGQGATPLAAA